MEKQGERVQRRGGERGGREEPRSEAEEGEGKVTAGIGEGPAVKVLSAR